MPRETAPSAEPNPDYALTQKLIAEHRQLFVDQLREVGGSHVRFSRLSILAFTQIAAVLAVDVGMNQDQFAAVCSANYKEAHKRAPRFS